VKNGVVKAVAGYRSPRRFAFAGATGRSARLWSTSVVCALGQKQTAATL